MFTVYRNWFKYGHEWDEVMVTWKDFTTFEKALAYVERYAVGIRYCSAQIEDEAGQLVAEHIPDKGWFFYKKSFTA